MSQQLMLPYADLSPREAFLTRVPAQHRPIVCAIYDLADDHVEWSGPNRVLAERMGCVAPTAGRRAKAAAACGLLHVEVSRGRVGRYRLLCVRAQVDEVGTSAPKWSAAGAHVGLLFGAVIGAVGALFGGPLGAAVTTSAVTAGLAAVETYQRRRRRAATKGQQTLFDNSATSARPPQTSAPPAQVQPYKCAEARRSEVSPAHVEVNERATVSPMPCHTIVPSPSPIPQKSNSIVPLHEALQRTSKKKLAKWWEENITPDHLKTPARLQRLYDLATSKGAFPESEQHRIQFFAFAALTLRQAEKPGAFFVHQLGQPGRTEKGETVPFAGRPSNADTDWANAAIKSLDLRPLQAPRTADLLADVPSTQATEIARLKAKFPNLS